MDNIGAGGEQCVHVFFFFFFFFFFNNICMKAGNTCK